MIPVEEIVSLQDGGSAMIKFNIFNMKNFLKTVNGCQGEVYLLSPDGKKTNINGQPKIQRELWEQYRQNKNCLKLVLKIPNPKDYMSIVSYYIEDC